MAHGFGFGIANSDLITSRSERCGESFMFRCDFCTKVFDGERQCIVHERTEHADGLRANDSTSKRPLEMLTRIVEDGWRFIGVEEATEVQMVKESLCGL